MKWFLKGENNESVKAMKTKGGDRVELEGPQGSGGESEGPWDVNPIFQK